CVVRPFRALKQATAGAPDRPSDGAPAALTEEQMHAPRFVIAGGGTGGHVAPAIALADEIASRFGREAVHFLCSGNAVERSMLGHAGYDFTELPVSRPRGTLRSKATTVVSSAMAVPAAR